MTPQQRRIYRDRLAVLRQRLCGDMNQMTGDALAANEENARRNRMPIHMAEAASNHFDQELSLALASSKGDILREIEHALERIEDNVYGT